jgi:hypothetical protein
MLLPADRFLAVNAAASAPALVRNHLLGRLGVFGARSAIHSIRMGATGSASKPSNALIRRSGIADMLDDLAASTFGPAVFESIDYFRRRAGRPLSTKELADAAGVIVRTWEGMLIEV